MPRRALLLCALVLALISRATSSPANPNAILWAYSYDMYYGLPQATKDAILKWMAPRWDVVVGAHGDPRPYNPAIRRSGYVNHAYLYAHQLYAWQKDVAAAHGFIAEDMLNHYGSDISVGAGLGWRNLDQFDAFEQIPTESGGVPAMARNGVLLLSGFNYNDATTAAYDDIAADVAVPDAILIGYAEPFDRMLFNVAAGAAGTSITWQYWNGAWMTLAPASDGTSGLARSGAVLFTPPGDWTVHSENGSRTKYWVRGVVSGSGAHPVLTWVRGDDWHNVTQDACRGWNKDAPGIVNRGLGNLEYNPTPPVGASARFRYQARVTGVWAPNATAGNYGDVQRGIPTWGQRNVDHVMAGIVAGGQYNGVMFDDLTVCTETPETGTKPCIQLARELLQWETATLHALAPGLTTGSNTVSLYAGMGGDTIFTEGTFSTRENPPHYWYGNDWVSQLEAYRPDRNPSGVKGLHQCWDNSWNMGADSVTGDHHFWDRANRGPMLCLAIYYASYNPNIGLMYSTTGYRPVLTDEFWQVSDFSTVLSAPVAASAGADRDYEIPVASTAGMPFDEFFPIRIGEPGPNGGDQDWAHLIGGRLYARNTIHLSYPAGTIVRFGLMRRQSIDPIPVLDRVFSWGAWFPGMEVDLGGPDPAGYNGGQRDDYWISGSAATSVPSHCGPAVGACPPVVHRDFIKAVVLYRPQGTPGGTGWNRAETDTPSVPIPLGRTYYPLQADGKTTAGVSSIVLRGGEAAILMKAPVGAAAIGVSIAPALSSLAAGQQAQFVATVTGGSGTAAVTWTLTPATGTISGSGLYTAPSPVSAAQTVTVTAASVEDPARSASATLSLIPAPVVQSLTPSAVLPGSTATVTILGVHLTGARLNTVAGVTVTALSVENSTRLLATITVDANAVPGVRKWNVATPGGISADLAFTLLPPATLATLEVSDAWAAGGTGFQVGFRLSAPATAPAVLTLSSRIPSAAAVPPSIPIAPGQAAGTIPVSTFPVTLSTAVEITATCGGVSRTLIVTVAPPALENVSPLALSLSGNTAADLTVALSGPPASAIDVSVINSHPALVAVPASMRFTAGQTSGKVRVKSGLTGMRTQVLLTFSFGGRSIPVSLEVTPSALDRLGSAAVTVAGGDSVSVAFYLTAPVPDSSAAVSLASSAPAAASVPATVPVVPGRASGQFLIRTRPVAADATALVTAEFGGVTRTVAVTVTAPR